MKLGFLELLHSERGLYFEQAAIRKNLAPVIIEKDFWVCWLLGILFESRFSPEIVFKGGTSLSKVYQVIERFSEDIDLSLSPDFLKLPEAGTSGKQADLWMTRAEKACSDVVRDQIAPELERSVTDVLGSRDSSWFEFIADSQTKSPVLLFHYPSLQPSGVEYIQRSVKLEFGSLTEQQPTGNHPIRPWIADILPDAFPDWQCRVVALDVVRTFWEKATILHSEYHRPIGKPTPDRFSRHYADLAALSLTTHADEALKRDEIRNQVVTWKGRYFRSGWSSYGTAQPGKFRLVPPEERLLSLRRDYGQMRDMYLSPPPSFDEVLGHLTTLQARINAPKDATNLPFDTRHDR